uniref:Uncharacterized protein n=1 Tax=Chrysotila carterae TaxID=13221 RepID=A0A7S4B6E6_CHRCT
MDGPLSTRGAAFARFHHPVTAIDCASVCSRSTTPRLIVLEPHQYVHQRVTHVCRTGDVMQTGSSGSGARVATLVVACAALLGLSAYGSVATRRALAKLRRQRDPADAVSLHAFQEKLVQ